MSPFLFIVLRTVRQRSDERRRILASFQHIFCHRDAAHFITGFQQLINAAALKFLFTSRRYAVAAGVSPQHFGAIEPSINRRRYMPTHAHVDGRLYARLHIFAAQDAR